jgi:O-antigen/teichoic acid export membrane protein
MDDGMPGSATVSRVARGGVTAFFVYGAGFGLTYCSQLVIARIVGVDTYGVYAYVFAWMVVLAYFSTLGFDVGLLRFVPAYEAERAWPLLQGVIQYAQRRAAFVGFSVIFIGICAVNAWTSSPELRSTFLAGFALVPILALVRIRCSAVRAFGGVVSALVPDRVVREGTLIGLLAVASLGMGWTLNAPFVMVATLISSTLGLVCAGLAMRRRRPRAIHDILPAYDAAAWRRAAIPLLILGATEALMNRTGVILLGWIADTKNAGICSRCC